MVRILQRLVLLLLFPSSKASVSMYNHRARGERSSVWLEHLVVVQRVAGSSPVARPIFVLGILLPSILRRIYPLRLNHKRHFVIILRRWLDGVRFRFRNIFRDRLRRSWCGHGLFWRIVFDDWLR